MRIVAADPQARALSEREVIGLLAEPIVMRLGMVDGQGWPLAHPVWHVFEDEVLRVAVGKTSRKANVLLADQRAYFAVDTGGASGETRGVRGRAAVRVIDGDLRLGVDVTRKGLLKYMGTDKSPYAEEMLKWARDGNMAVLELRPASFCAFAY